MSRIALLPRTPLENPYFISLAKQKRLCPICGKPTSFSGSLSPNGAYEFCEVVECPLAHVLVDPEWAEVGGKRRRSGERPSAGFYLVE